MVISNAIYSELSTTAEHLNLMKYFLHFSLNAYCIPVVNKVCVAFPKYIYELGQRCVWVIFI